MARISAYPHVDQLKLQAKQLRTTLKEKYQLEIGHGQTLDLVARSYGLKDWNVLSALSGGEPNLENKIPTLGEYIRAIAPAEIDLPVGFSGSFNGPGRTDDTGRPWHYLSQHTLKILEGSETQGSDGKRKRSVSHVRVTIEWSNTVDEAWRGPKDGQQYPPQYSTKPFDSKGHIIGESPEERNRIPQVTATWGSHHRNGEKAPDGYLYKGDTDEKILSPDFRGIYDKDYEDTPSPEEIYGEGMDELHANLGEIAMEGEGN
jgi:hypothetical protein